MRRHVTATFRWRNVKGEDYTISLKTQDYDTVALQVGAGSPNPEDKLPAPQVQG